MAIPHSKVFCDCPLSEIKAQGTLQSTLCLQGPPTYLEELASADCFRHPGWSRFCILKRPKSTLITYQNMLWWSVFTFVFARLSAPHLSISSSSHLYNILISVFLNRKFWDQHSLKFVHNWRSAQLVKAGCSLHILSVPFISLNFVFLQIALWKHRNSTTFVTLLS